MDYVPGVSNDTPKFWRVVASTAVMDNRVKVRNHILPNLRANRRRHKRYLYCKLRADGAVIQSHGAAGFDE